jgi:hypothetical protein
MISAAELLERFEDLSLPAENFRHEDHLRLAWHITGQCSLNESIERFVKGLKRFADHNGVPGLYHETVTLFYLYEIYARRHRLPATQTWEDFRSHNTDLFVSHREFIARHYPEELLNSTAAKEHFIPPRLGSLGELTLAK